jgi:hypothetical protein
MLGSCIVSPNRLRSAVSDWNSRRQASPAPVPTQDWGPLYFVGNWCLRVFGVVGAISLVPIATALIGWCPAYRLLGINTCPRKD